MKTEKHRHRKLPCNIRGFLMWLSVIGFTIMCNAQVIPDPIADNNDIITGISYDYEIIETEYQRLQCCGSLHLSLNITDDIESLIFERTSAHDYDKPSSHLVFAKRELDLEDYVSIDDFPWRVRFRILIWYKDGSSIHTDLYDINNYIDEEDIKLLYASSSVASVADNGLDMTLDNGSVHLKAPGKCRLDIFESSGRMIFTTTINGSETLNLHDFNCSNTSTIIVRLQSAGKEIVKKIHIP